MLPYITRSVASKSFTFWFLTGQYSMVTIPRRTASPAHCIHFYMQGPSIYYVSKISHFQTRPPRHTRPHAKSKRLATFLLVASRNPLQYVTLWNSKILTIARLQFTFLNFARSNLSNYSCIVLFF